MGGKVTQQAPDQPGPDGEILLQIIPNSNPPVRFKLNHNSTRLAPGEIDTSIWVGDLTPEVDDFALYRYFTTRYGTVRCAKVEQRFPLRD